MIRKTLKRVQEATFCVELPNTDQHGMPSPTGTGFFVSPDGWFITAAHVVTEDGTPNGKPREDFGKWWLQKERSFKGPGAMCQFMALEQVIARHDVALIKVDFQKNANKMWLENRNSFPYIQVSVRGLEMGEPVYSFGYPLSTSSANKVDGGGVVGTTQLSPRVTSAIVASELEMDGSLMTSNDPKLYVLDKALNYGNSGGPIISSDTGNVHALCSRFQPLYVPQLHLKDDRGHYPHVMIPSLYGVVSSLANVEIVELFHRLGIEVSDE